MTRRQAPRLALALLDRLVPDSEPLAGDLVEQFESRPSIVWFWVQVVTAIVMAAPRRAAEIRPLRLVDLQPADALERSRRFNLRFPPVTPNGTAISGVGGLGLAVLAGLVTMVMPGAWWVLLASAVAGVGIGIAAISLRGRSHHDSTRLVTGLPKRE